MVQYFTANKHQNMEGLRNRDKYARTLHQGAVRVRETVLAVVALDKNKTLPYYSDSRFTESSAISELLM